MSAEDLEKYETEMELTLYKEYRDIVSQFSYVVETERRFYLANSVDVAARNADGEIYFEVRAREARPAPARGQPVRHLAGRRGGHLALRTHLSDLAHTAEDVCGPSTPDRRCGVGRAGLSTSRPGCPQITGHPVRLPSAPRSWSVWQRRTCSGAAARISRPTTSSSRVW